MAITKTPYRSWCSGELCEGCKRCVRGEKLVLFITGLCAQHCFYCPVAENKYGNDVVYANEWKLKNPDDPKELLEEARLTKATGAGITGGDPLVKTDRCVTYIKLLKKEFGKAFHIHLYTPLILVNEERLQALYEAGLDEIRFHPDLDNDRFWKNITLAKKFLWKIGVEIPCIPGYEEKTKKLIDFLQGKIDFINVNELELSDTKAVHYTLHELGFKPKDDISYAVAGSEELGKKLIEYAASKGIPGHFCTAALKDGVQVQQRIIRRAENIALPFDKKTPEGLLVRGCAYLHELAPGVGYRDKLTQDTAAAVEKLKMVRAEIVKKLKAKEEDIVMDTLKPRLLLSAKLVKKEKKLFKKLGLLPAVVEEYPTRDAFEVEVEFL